jgi:hypothetical protein
MLLTGTRSLRVALAAPSAPTIAEVLTASNASASAGTR